MVKFYEYKASHRLSELAIDPIDLTSDLTPERLAHCVIEGGGYKVLYGTERVDEKVLESLSALAAESEAVDWMEKMQAGETVNCIHGHLSENRAAHHTALRDTKSTHPHAKAAQKEVEKLQQFLLKSESFQTLILIGIGGSDLGPRANYYALQAHHLPNKSVHFISNVDADEAFSVLRACTLEHTLVVVISKSGTTNETRTNEALVRSAFEKAGLNSDQHFIAVTGENSPMDDPKRYLERFYIWDWVGGRYSSTSMVGGVLIGFACGFEVYKAFLSGAHAMDKVAKSRSIYENVPLFLALISIWNHNFLGYPTLALIPYSQPLFRYPAHIQQVEMESNGKRVDRDGDLVYFETAPIIWGEPGTNAQHSFFQLLHQGTATVPVEFVAYTKGVEKETFSFEGSTSRQKLLANLFAQSIALAQGAKNENPNKNFPGNRPSHIILGEELTPHTLGALLSLFEHKVAFEGFIWGINSFDQEGVQLGKVLAKQVLDAFKTPNSYPLGAELIRHLHTSHDD